MTTVTEDAGRSCSAATGSGKGCATEPPQGAIAPAVAADGVTDDREAIQRALDAAPGDRQCTIWLPGLCYVGAGGQTGGAPFGLVMQRSRVRLTGAPGAGLVSDVPGIRLLLIGTAGSAPRDPLAPDGWVTALPVAPFAEEVKQGSVVLRLKRRADAADIRPGDIVFLRTGQLTNAKAAREPDAELNRVDEVRGRSIVLRHPTAKPYRPEHMTVGAQGPSETDGSGRPCPWGLTVARGHVVEDVVVRGLRLLARSTDGPCTAVRLQQVWGAVVEDCSLEFGKYGIAGRYSRGVTVRNTEIFALGSSADNDPAWIAPSTGCTDWLVDRCRGSGAVPAKIHAHEGVADFRVTGWRSTTPDGAGQSGAANVSIRQRAYRHHYDVTMSGAYTDAGCSMLRVTSSVTGPSDQVRFERLALRGRPGWAFLVVESGAVTIDPGGLDLPEGASIRLSSGARPFD